MSENYTYGVTPQPSDTERQLLVRILNSLNKGSSLGGGAGLTGSGAPTAATTAGTTYLDTASNNFWVYNGTTWVELIGA